MNTLFLFIFRMNQTWRCYSIIIKKKFITIDQKYKFYTVSTILHARHLAKNDICHTLSLEQQQHRVHAVALDWSAKNDICHCGRPSETTTTTQDYGGQRLLETCLNTLLVKRFCSQSRGALIKWPKNKLGKRKKMVKYRKNS